MGTWRFVTVRSDISRLGPAFTKFIKNCSVILFTQLFLHLSPVTFRYKAHTKTTHLNRLKVNVKVAQRIVIWSSIWFLLFNIILYQLRSFFFSFYFKLKKLTVKFWLNVVHSHQRKKKKKIFHPSKTELELVKVVGVFIANLTFCQFIQCLAHFYEAHLALAAIVNMIRQSKPLFTCHRVLESFQAVCPVYQRRVGDSEWSGWWFW